MFFRMERGFRKGFSNKISGSRRRAKKNRWQIEKLEPRQMMHGDGLDHELPEEPAPDIQLAAVAAVSPTAVLPDLIPWVDEAKGFLYDWTIQGELLRLTTAMANVGSGALEIRGGNIIGENIQEVYQRVYEPDGSFNDRVAGTFTYHPEHKHIHFDGFAEFRLREVLPEGGVGAVVAGGLKTSFCIIDIENYDSDLPAKYLNCKQVQGLSPGWADLYDSGLPGQSIDITGIPNGTYWLEMAVDPDDHIAEADEANNVARILINLNRDGSPTDADTFEPNDSFAAASILAPPEDHLYENLSIHESGNKDYFRVTASATGKLTVNIDFQNPAGDLDLALYNAAQNKVAESRTAKNRESVTVDAKAGDIFYIRVWGYQTATNPNYSMFVDQPEPDDEDSGDIFEDNDTFATAAHLDAVDQVYSNLSILRSNDDDYYSIVPTETGSLAINLTFQNAQGNLELELYDSAQTKIASAATTGNGEQLRIPVVAGQTYFVRVLGKSGATNTNYSLGVDLIEAGASTFQYFSTTAAATLKSTDGSPNLASDDSDIVKLAVRGDGLYGYSTHFDGSDVGLSSDAEDVDAFAFRADGSILISTTGAFSVPAPGGGTLAGSGHDLLLFTPTSLGDTTAGTWSLYFDGSDVGLTTTNENIDAVAELSDGRILISTSGAVSVTGASGQDEDLIAFAPTSLGDNTAGTWSLYFDGSAVGLTTNDAEDVSALYVAESGGLPTLYLATRGNFSVTGASGANEDVVAFNPTSLGTTTAGSFGPGLAFDGSQYGLSSLTIDGISLGVASPTFQTLAQTTSLRTTEDTPTAMASTTAPSTKKGNVKAKPAANKANHNEPNTTLAVLTTSAKKGKSKTKSLKQPDCGCQG